MTRPGEPSNRGFLLRVWETGDRSQPRLSITDVDTRETRVFVDIDGLCRWLRRLARGDPPTVGPPPPSDTLADGA